jgi:hypothetical protein
MSTNIIPDKEQSLDELIVRARNDPGLKRLLEGKMQMKKQYYVLVCNTLSHICAVNGTFFEDLSEFQTTSVVYALGQLFAISYPNNVVNLNTGERYVLHDFNKINRLFNNAPQILAAGEGKNGGGLVRPVRVKRPKKKYHFDTEVTAVCSPERSRDLYVGDFVGKITRIRPNGEYQVICEDPDKNFIRAMCFKEDDLYFAVNDSVYVMRDDKLMKKVAQRPASVNGLCIFNGRVVDAVHRHGIWDTESDERIFSTSESIYGATAMRYGAYLTFKDENRNNTR